MTLLINCPFLPAFPVFDRSEFTVFNKSRYRSYPTAQISRVTRIRNLLDHRKSLTTSECRTDVSSVGSQRANHSIPTSYRNMSRLDFQHWRITPYWNLYKLLSSIDPYIVVKLLKTPLCKTPRFWVLNPQVFKGFRKFLVWIMRLLVLDLGFNVVLRIWICRWSVLLIRSRHLTTLTRRQIGCNLNRLDKMT